MKKIYTIIFSQNNLVRDENYFMDFNQVKKDEIVLNQYFDKIQLVPRQEIVNRILDFAKDCK